MSFLDKLHRNDQAREIRPEAELKKLFGKHKDNERAQEQEQQDGDAAKRLATIALNGSVGGVDLSANVEVGKDGVNVQANADAAIPLGKKLNVNVGGEVNANIGKDGTSVDAKPTVELERNESESEQGGKKKKGLIGKLIDKGLDRGIDQVNDKLEEVTDQASVPLLQKRNKLGVGTPDLGPQAYGDGRLSAIAESESIVPHEATHVLQQGAATDVVQTGAQVVDNVIGDVKPTSKRSVVDPAGVGTMIGQGIQNMQEGGGPEIIDVADPIQPLRRMMKRGPRDAQPEHETEEKQGEEGEITQRPGMRGLLSHVFGQGRGALLDAADRMMPNELGGAVPQGIGPTNGARVVMHGADNGRQVLDGIGSQVFGMTPGLHGVGTATGDKHGANPNARFAKVAVDHEEAHLETGRPTHGKPVKDPRDLKVTTDKAQAKGKNDELANQPHGDEDLDHMDELNLALDQDGDGIVDMFDEQYGLDDIKDPADAPGAIAHVRGQANADKGKVAARTQQHAATAGKKGAGHAATTKRHGDHKIQNTQRQGEVKRTAARKQADVAKVAKAKDINELKLRLADSWKKQEADLKAEVEKQRGELKTKLAAEKKRLDVEIKAQEAKLKQQIDQKNAELEKKIAAKKAELEKKAQAEAKKAEVTTRAEQLKVKTAGDTEARRIETQGKSEADKVNAQGKSEAGGVRSKGRSEAAAARHEGEVNANRIMSGAKGGTDKERESAQKRATQQATAARAAANHRAQDITTKHESDAKTVETNAKAEAEKRIAAAKDLAAQTKAKAVEQSTLLEGKLVETKAKLLDIGAQMDAEKNAMTAEVNKFVDGAKADFQKKTDESNVKLGEQEKQSLAKIDTLEQTNKKTAQVKHDDMLIKLESGSAAQLAALEIETQKSIGEIEKTVLTAKMAVVQEVNDAQAAAARATNDRILAVQADGKRALDKIVGKQNEAEQRIETAAQVAAQKIKTVAENHERDTLASSAASQLQLKTMGDKSVEDLKKSSADFEKAKAEEAAAKAAEEKKKADLAAATAAAEQQKLADAKKAEEQRKIDFQNRTKGAADDLFKAMDGWGTDEKKVFAALRGKSPEELKAIKDAYLAKTGRALDADLTSEMSGSELKEAKGLLAQDPVQSAVAALENSKGGFFTGPDRAKIQETLNGITDPELKRKVIEEYEKQTGERLNKMLADSNMQNAGVNPEAFKLEKTGPTLDPEEVKKLTQSKDVKLAASAILAATDRWGTDEKAISDALKGKSPAEIEAIRQAFKEHSGGKDLDTVLEEELSGTELKEAKALLSDDPVQKAVAQLQNAADGWGTDKEKIHATLKDITDPELRRQVTAQYEKQTGEKLDSMLESELSGFDKDLARAYAKGDKADIAATEADKAMHGGFLTDIADGIADTVGVDRKAVRDGMVGPLAMINGKDGVSTDMGTDNAALFAALESAKTPEERQALRDAYKKRTGMELDKDVERDLEGKEKDIARFTLAGDTTSAQAAKLFVAGDGLGTDRKGIYDALEKCESKEERERLVAKYNELYGKDGQNFDQMLKGELDELDYAKAKQLERSGKMDDGFALYYAMNEGWLGIGTDDDALKQRLRGKSKEEIEVLKRQYAEAAKTYGGRDNADLTADVSDETSGRVGHELSQSLKGNPTTLEEARQRAAEDYEFERHSSGWVGEVGLFVLTGGVGYGALKASGVNASDIGNGLTDMWSGSGKRLDQTHLEVEAEYLRIKSDPRFAAYDTFPPGSPERQQMDKEMLSALQGKVDWQEGDTKGFAEAKDATADVAGTAVALAVGAVITVASGGTAAPAVVALLSGLAGLGTTMMIRGAAMSNEEVVQQLAAVIAETAAAGIVKIDKIDKLVSRLGTLAGGGNHVVAEIMKEALQEAIESGSEELINAMLDPSLYKGDIVDWAKGVTARTGKAIGTGALAAAVSTGAGEVIGDTKTIGGRMVKGGATQMIGSATTTAIDPSTYEGSQEEKLTRFGRSQVEAGLRGARDSMGGGGGHTDSDKASTLGRSGTTSSTGLDTSTAGTTTPTTTASTGTTTNTHGLQTSTTNVASTNVDAQTTNQVPVQTTMSTPVDSTVDQKPTKGPLETKSDELTTEPVALLPAPKPMLLLTGPKTEVDAKGEVTSQETESETPTPTTKTDTAVTTSPVTTTDTTTDTTSAETEAPKKHAANIAATVTDSVKSFFAKVGGLFGSKSNTDTNEPPALRTDFKGVEPGQLPEGLSRPQEEAFQAANKAYERLKNNKFGIYGEQFAHMSWAQMLNEAGIKVETGLADGGKRDRAVEATDVLDREGKQPQHNAEQMLGSDESQGERSPTSPDVHPGESAKIFVQVAGTLKGVEVVSVEGTEPVRMVIAVPGKNGIAVNHVIKMLHPDVLPAGQLAGMRDGDNETFVWISQRTPTDQMARVMGGIIQQALATKTGGDASHAGQVGQLDAMLGHLQTVTNAPTPEPSTNPKDLLAVQTEKSKRENPARIQAEIDLQLSRMGLDQPGPDREAALAKLPSGVQAEVRKYLETRTHSIGFNPNATIDQASVAIPAAATGTSTVLAATPENVRPYGEADRVKVLELRVVMEQIAECDARLKERDVKGTQQKGQDQIAQGESLRRRELVFRQQALMAALQLGGTDKAYYESRLAELDAVFPGVSQAIKPTVDRRIEGYLQAQRAKAEALQYREKALAAAANIEAKLKGATDPFLGGRIVVGDGIAGMSNIATLDHKPGSDGFMDPSDCIVVGGLDLVARMAASDPNMRWGQRAGLFDPESGDQKGHQIFRDEDGSSTGDMQRRNEDDGDFVTVGELSDSMDLARQRMGVARVQAKVLSVELEGQNRGKPWPDSAKSHPVRVTLQFADGTTKAIYLQHADLTVGLGKAMLSDPSIISETDKNEMFKNNVLVGGEELMTGKNVEGKRVLVVGYGPTGGWASVEAAKRGASAVDWTGSSGQAVGDKGDNASGLKALKGVDRVQEAFDPRSKVNISADRVLKIKPSGTGAEVTFVRTGEGGKLETYTVLYDHVVMALPPNNSGTERTVKGGDELANAGTMLAGVDMQPQAVQEDGTAAPALESTANKGAVRVLGAAAADGVGLTQQQQAEMKERNKQVKLSADSPDNRVMEFAGEAAELANRDAKRKNDEAKLSSSVSQIDNTFGAELGGTDTNLVAPTMADKPILQRNPADALIGLPLEVIPATLSGADALTQLEQQGIPRWPLLTAKERAHEDAFLSEIEAPGAMSEVVERFTAMSTDSGGVMVFEVDGAKKLYSQYGTGKSPQGTSESDVRATANHALHPAAVAITRIAFLKALDQIASLDPSDPKRNIFVTNGGCAAGKGSLTDIVKGQNGGNFPFGVVWDAAGEGDAQENGWILQAAQQRGLKVTFGFVQNDPMFTYNAVLNRALGSGRIVDPLTFARSYARGQQNMADFLDSDAYKAAQASGQAETIGMYTGKFDTTTNTYPDAHKLGDAKGNITSGDIQGAPNEAHVTSAAIDIFKQWIEKQRAAGKPVDHWIEGGLASTKKFDPKAEAHREADIGPVDPTRQSGQSVESGGDQQQPVLDSAEIKSKLATDGFVRLGGGNGDVAFVSPIVDTTAGPSPLSSLVDNGQLDATEKDERRVGEYGGSFNGLDVMSPNKGGELGNQQGNRYLVYGRMSADQVRYGATAETGFENIVGGNKGLVSGISLGSVSMIIDTQSPMYQQVKRGMFVEQFLAEIDAEAKQKAGQPRSAMLALNSPRAQTYTTHEQSLESYAAWKLLSTGIKITPEQARQEIQARINRNFDATGKAVGSSDAMWSPDVVAKGDQERDALPRPAPLPTTEKPDRAPRPDRPPQESMLRKIVEFMPGALGMTFDAIADQVMKLFRHVPGVETGPAPDVVSSREVNDDQTQTPGAGDGKFQLQEMSDETARVLLKLKLKPEPGVSPEELEKVKQQARDGMAKYWDRQFTIAGSDGIPRELRFDVEFVDTGWHHEVEIKKGNMMSRDDSLGWYTSSDVHTKAHEMGHLMGLPDEYWAGLIDSTGNYWTERQRLTSPFVKWDMGIMGHGSRTLERYGDMMMDVASTKDEKIDAALVGESKMPALPAGMTARQMGDQLGWGRTNEDAVGRANSITKSELESAGLNAASAKEWAEFFRDGAKRHPTSACDGRATLMARAARLLSGS